MGNITLKVNGSTHTLDRRLTVPVTSAGPAGTRDRQPDPQRSRSAGPHSASANSSGPAPTGRPV
jgi:hypothetical protein